MFVSLHTWSSPGGDVSHRRVQGYAFEWVESDIGASESTSACFVSLNMITLDRDMVAGFVFVSVCVCLESCSKAGLA